ncbi:alpha/beta-hydrolase [Rhizodiscina lignyota]|uniref:Alpha/beta-hydrolase n=1 Tax=Rhizodiscina lignyota TaxID=1504668 RepID=A0A9P4HZY8_9PEZI|nr:alpha/beta-hydrolase [Rhizodiscina lignyota]
MAVAGGTYGSKGFNLRPFKVELSSGLPRMFDLVKNTELPAHEEYPGVGSSFGIGLDVLKSLKKEWLTNFDWQKAQASMNRYEQYTVEIEGLTIHFVHEKSKDPHAIPIILQHGWPGSFLEMVPIIDPLKSQAKTSTGKPISFNVVVPSLPGHAFSSAPPANWTVEDTARVFNTLMTKVLGYGTYAVHGTDWGSATAYSMYDQFNQSARAAHLNFLPYFPLLPEALVAQNISLSPEEEFEEQRLVDWETNGNAYLVEQTTKPNTIGLAIYDSPLGQLSWIAEKYIAWSDPRQGTGPSLLTHNEILTEVSLYYLTRSIVSSMYIYAQNPNGFMTTYHKARTDAPLLFSSFKYNVGFWPQQLVARVGNLVKYTYHSFGGHFPGLDNPPALTADIREIGNYWEH